MAKSNPNLSIDVFALVGEPAAAFAGLQGAVVKAVARRNIDALSYHMRSVLKYHGLPGKRQAQKMLAKRLFRYGRTRKDPQSLRDVQGESFAVEGAGGYGDDFFKLMEEGGVRNASTPMVIPVGRGRGPGGFKRMRELIAARKLVLVKGGYLVRELGRGKRGKFRKNARTELWGKLSRSQTISGGLGFGAIWTRNLSKVQAKYERDLLKILDSAERATDEQRVRLGDAKARLAAMEAAGRARARRVASRPISDPAARRAGQLADASVSADRLSGGGA